MGIRRVRIRLGKVMGTARVLGTVTFIVFPGGHLSPLLFLGCLLKTLLCLHQNLGSRKQSAKVTPTEGHMSSVSLPELCLCARALSTPRGTGALWTPPCRGFTTRSQWGGGPELSTSPAAAVLGALKGTVWLTLPQHGFARQLKFLSKGIV